MRKRERKEVTGGTARKNKAKNGAKWESGVMVTVEKKGTERGDGRNVKEK